MKSGYSWVTSSKLSITTGEFLHSSVETSGGVTLNFANSDLSSSNAGYFEVKTVPKLRHHTVSLQIFCSFSVSKSKLVDSFIILRKKSLDEEGLVMNTLISQRNKQLLSPAR